MSVFPFARLGDRVCTMSLVQAARLCSMMFASMMLLTLRKSLRLAGRDRNTDIARGLAAATVASAALQVVLLRCSWIRARRACAASAFCTALVVLGDRDILAVLALAWLVSAARPALGDAVRAPVMCTVAVARALLLMRRPRYSFSYC